MTTRHEIREWLAEAKANGATHMLVVCDTYDWENYPVSVRPTQTVQKFVEEYSCNMQKVVEVYNMSMDLESQISEHRSFNL